MLFCAEQKAVWQSVYSPRRKNVAEFLKKNMYPIETEIIFILMSGSNRYELPLSVSNASEMNIGSHLCPSGCMQLLKRPNSDVLYAIYRHLYLQIHSCSASPYENAAFFVNGI